MSLQALIEWLSVYGYPILFVVVFAENAGLPVPGETAVLVSGLLAGRPDAPLSLFWVIVVTFVAAVLGDNLGFWLGRRWARARLEQGKRFLFLTPKALQSVEGYFEHYGTLTIFFARFVAGLRVVAALAAGTSRMPWVKFLLANAAGAAAWSVTMSLLGFFFGQSFQTLHKWLGRGALIIVACVIVLVGLPYLLRRLRKLPEDSWNRLLRTQLWQGVLAALLVVVCVTVLLLLSERHRTQPDEDTDTEVKKWIEAQSVPVLDAVAVGGSYLGSLPVVTALTVLLVLQLWYARRPWGEPIAMLWALLASEGLGLLLLGLIRHHGVEPPRAPAWPFGFAGLAPLRGAAVYGMLAQLLRRQSVLWGRLAAVLGTLIILLIGFGVVWSHRQFLSEVLVEYVAGTLVVFLGLWWLEGYGLGPQPGPADVRPAQAQ